LDALSQSGCGFASLAVGGTSVPAWLVEGLSFRRARLPLTPMTREKPPPRVSSALAARGALYRRLLPSAGNKDWKELLQKGGREGVEEVIAPFLLEG